MPVTTYPVSYTTPGAVYSGFPPISSVTALTSGIVHSYCGQVEAEINAKIVKRYALPLGVECPILSVIATRETIYRIAVERSLIQFSPAQQMQHPLQISHSSDQKLLQGIVDGKVQLLDNSFNVIAANASGAREIYTTTMDYNPTMHEGRWEDMTQDPTKLQDIEDDRA